MRSPLMVGAEDGDITDVTELNEGRQRIELEQQRLQLKTITDAIPPLIAFVDQDQRYQFVNAAYAKEWSRPAEEIMGHKVIEVVGADNFAKIEPHLTRSLQGHKECYELEVHIPQVARVLHKEVTYVPALKTDGSIAGVSVVINDITERKRREQATAFLAELRDKLFGLETVEEILRVACRDVSSYLDLSCLLVSETSEDVSKITVISDHHDTDINLSGTYELSDFISVAERQQLSIGQPVVIHDTNLNRTAIPFSEFRVGAIVKAPCSRDQKLKFLLSALKELPHHWRADEIEIIQEVANILPLKIDRARAEWALRESEARFRDLADNISQLAWMTDSTGMIHWYNRRWFEYTGTTMEDMRGWGWRQVHHPDYIDRVVDRWNEHLASGEIWEDTFPLRSKDGEYRWFLSRAQPIRDGNGAILRWFGSNTDITEAKEQEQRIRASEERLRSAAEAAGFGMIHADLDTRTAMFSDELRRLIDLPGNEQERVAVHHLPDWIHPSDRTSVSSFVKEVMQLREGTTQSIDLRILRRDGDIRWARLQAKPVYTGTGSDRRVSQLIGTVLDITKQREFEQSLSEAREMAEAASESKSAFLANMSHEIRTPMTAILGYTDLVADRVHDEEAVEYLKTIRRNGYFLLDIINDILDLSKIEAGVTEIDCVRFAPDRLVEDVRSIMEVRASENKLILDVQYHGLIPAEIESDPKRLKQILINLVGNAIKFTKKGSVTLIISHNDGTLQIDVSDTGIGMSPRQLRRLFQPFSQGDHTVNREFGGTGLGLAISQRLAGMLGGEITVQSELNKGSTFRLTLATGEIPDVKFIQPMPMSEIQQLMPAAPEGKLDCNILVVDDRREIRFLSRRILTEAGARVTEAEDGEMAIRTVTNSISSGTTFDLVILDMQMPKLDGYQTAKQLRMLGFEGPIIALTADAMQGDMSRCIECGCNNYLSKPIDKFAILQMVRSYVGVNSPLEKLSTPEANNPLGW